MPFYSESIAFCRTNPRIKVIEKGISALRKSLSECVYVLFSVVFQPICCRVSMSFSVVFQYLARHKTHVIANSVELAE